MHRVKCVVLIHSESIILASICIVCNLFGFDLLAGLSDRALNDLLGSLEELLLLELQLSLQLLPLHVRDKERGHEVLY